MDFLLFILSGTFSAWGPPLAGTTRKTDDHPTKVGITGFLAACMGITDTMDQEFANLGKIGMACREDSPGESYRDYHIVRVGPGIVSERYYLSGAVFTICLWKTEDCNYTLDQISDKIKTPIFYPYLGRKCCSLNCFPSPKIISAQNLSEAFDSYKIPDFFKSSSDKKRIFWEGDDLSIIPKSTTPRFDQVVGIKKNRVRLEHMGRKGDSNAVSE